MSHEIEADFVEESSNDERQCQHCNSCVTGQDSCFCQELEREVPEIGYCDFFQSKD